MRSSQSKLFSRTVTGLVAGLGLAASGLAGCGSAGPPRPTAALGSDQIHAPGPRTAGAGGKFAGLLRTGRLTSIGADWRVPVIQAGSQPGRAATWIGAQGLALTGAGPFIQIGTREELDSASAPDGRGELFYEAFWTDPEHGLHPISLFTVHARDTIRAHMTLRRELWTLTITDSSTGASRLVTTRDEGTGDFRLGLWIQEDPTSTATNTAVAYPDLSPLRMTALSVNGTRPPPAALESTWMVLPHTYLGPTATVGDAFSVVPRQLTGAGIRYLKLAAPVDRAVARFLAEAAKWRKGNVSGPEVRSGTDPLISALAAYVTQLRARPWPAPVAGLIRRLARTYTAQITALGHAENVGPAAVLAALPQGASGQTHVTLAGKIRAGLGLPRTSY